MYCKSNSLSKKTIIPKESQFFKEELVSEVLTIDCNKPEMERILDILVHPEVVNYKLIDTPIGESNEGQTLAGYKLIIEIKLNEKLTYVADEPTQSVHACYYEFMKSIFVVLPTEINGKNTCDLVRADRLEITPYIEAVKYRMLDCRQIHKCIMLFVDVKKC